MDILSGKRLTTAAVFLMASAAAAALRVALTEGLPGPAAPPGPAATASSGATSAGGTAALSLADRLARARAAEAAGDVALALSHYRAAAALDPRCVDRRSPAFLGPAFERNLRRWLSGLREGRIAGGGPALRDASDLFRRMYGGCG